MKPLPLALALVLLAAPAVAQERSIESCETVSTFPAVPERVITLNQQATEIMLALGLEAQMIGTAYLDDEIPERWRAAYEAVPVIADEYPAREVVLAANPDFLFAGFASAFADTALGAQQGWNEIGIGTYLVHAECRNLFDGTEPLTTDPLFTDLERIGALFGVEDRAEALAGGLHARFAAVADADPGAGQRGFLYDSGDDTAFSAGCCGAPGLLLDSVGLQNIAAGVEGRWADLAWEAVVEADPEVIVLVDAEWSTADEKIAHLHADPVLSELAAVQAERFVIVPFSATVLGVRFIEGVEDLGAALAALD